MTYVLKKKTGGGRGEFLCSFCPTNQKFKKLDHLQKNVFKFKKL